MVKNKKDTNRFVAIIPARGGSIGLPRKNLMEVQGISLISRAVLIAKMIKEIEWITVSTDDREIAKEAERAGAKISFLRPKYLARDNTPMISVLEHAYRWVRSSIPDVDTLCKGIVILQPTSPMRKVDHIVGAINLFLQLRQQNIEVAGIHTVSPVPENNLPENLLQIVKHNKSKDCDRIESLRLKNIKGFNQSEYYYRNGVAIVLDQNRLKSLTLSERPVFPYVIMQQLPTIDTIFDLLRIEYCGKRLEPDPIEIDWESHQIQGLCGKDFSRTRDNVI